MIFSLVIQKLDLYATDPYVVFGPEGDVPDAENRHRPRPKLTLGIEEWDRLGKPTMLALDVQTVEAEALVH